MTKKDLLELKRRFKKEECTFTRMCGCYVDSGKNKVVDFGETFLNLEDEEFYKYLDIVKKSLSGTIGNNLLNLEFPDGEDEVGGRQQFLMGLKDNKLKNPDLMDRFYDLIIENYNYIGNYLILIFHDAYDVITRTNDNAQLDESEEVYEYLLCAICPVALTKPGLGYRESENRIGSRIRDWVVGAPDTGFLFPAFTDRSADTDAVVYYTKNAKEPHSEFMEGVLGCNAKRTATEQKEVFHSILKNALGSEDDDDAAEEIIMEIQENLHGLVEDFNDKDSGSDPILLTNTSLSKIMTESGVPEEVVSRIETSYSEEFGATLPVAETLIDSKMVEANIKKKKEKELAQQVEVLQQQLDEKNFMSTDNDESDDTIKTYDVVLRVKPEKASQIKSQIIDGQKCLVIPMAENEHAAVNGVNTQV